MKILVVDDEKLLVKGIKFNLENEGYEVQTAYDGAAAVELARRENFDLIILDWMMPQLSGSDACMKIREFSDVPVIMLTARSEDADKLMGFACGADDYVTKPFEIKELLARVHAVMRRSDNDGPVDKKLNFEKLVINLDSYELVVDGKKIESILPVSIMSVFGDREHKTCSCKLYKNVERNKEVQEIKEADISTIRLKL